MKKTLMSLLAAISMNSVMAASVYDDSLTTPIVNIEVPTTYITYEQLKAIFTLQTQKWDDGSKIVVVLLPAENQLTKRFISEHLGLNSFRFSELIDAKTNSGKAKPPIIVDSEREMFSVVTRYTGAVGYANDMVIVGDKNGYRKLQVR